MKGKLLALLLVAAATGVRAAEGISDFWCTDIAFNHSFLLKHRGVAFAGHVCSKPPCSLRHSSAPEQLNPGSFTEPGALQDLMLALPVVTISPPAFRDEVQGAPVPAPVLSGGPPVGVAPGGTAPAALPESGETLLLFSIAVGVLGIFRSLGVTWLEQARPPRAVRFTSGRAPRRDDRASPLSR